MSDRFAREKETVKAIRRSASEYEAGKKAFWLVWGGTVDNLIRQAEKAERYERALKETRQYVMTLPLDREEDGSPIEDPISRFVYEVTNEALREDEGE